ncbi:MAG: YigZ family protein [Winogradskyella sp.]|uniref:IMPACT family protein n=1 Tax=Winogradskyella sp. TaxID=1883156 RepID=UPI0025FB5807|nr:YigZ family protein [Winogradskyella sp.]NRB59244.1 YigZ family protein [Winogradskyella sp.]
MKSKDTYKTISKKAEGELFKDKNSKFIGFAFPVLNDNDIKLRIEAVKKEHHAARHWCYAYQLGTSEIVYRANDDGEPSNSAGMPIYGQIKSFDVTNTLIVVVRYYGGVKLGVGGLINAYRTAAKSSLENAEIIEKTINTVFNLEFDYKHMSKVMRIIKEYRLNVLQQKLEHNCNLKISVRKSNAPEVFEIFNQFYQLEISEL